jgi:hypothetical protein
MEELADDFLSASVNPTSASAEAATTRHPGSQAGHIYCATLAASFAKTKDYFQRAASCAPAGMFVKI